MKAVFNTTASWIREAIGSDKKINWLDSERITSVCSSSQEAEHGTLFIPLVGNRDGHDFIEDAMKNGASFFICNRKYKKFKEVSKKYGNRCIPCADTLNALGDIAKRHRSSLSANVIAITGSSGKTTTKEFFRPFLSIFGDHEVLFTEKNYNNEIGLPFTILKMTQETRFAVLEMGMNHKGEISRLSKIARPDFALITGIGPAHIEHFKNIEEILKAKLEILDGMDAGDMLFFPAKSEFSQLAKSITEKKKMQIKFFGTEKIYSGITIENISENGIAYSFQKKNFHYPCPAPLILQNLSGVIQLLKEMNYPEDGLLKCLQEGNFYSVGNRLKIEKFGGCTWIEDSYNANPQSMESSLSVLKILSKGKKSIAVLGDMKELGSKSILYHKQLGKQCKDYGVKLLITFGQDSEICGTEFKKFGKHAKHFSEEEIKGLIGFLSENLENTVVLVKGSNSMKMERIVAGINEKMKMKI